MRGDQNLYNSLRQFGGVVHRRSAGGKVGKVRAADANHLGVGFRYSDLPTVLGMIEPTESYFFSNELKPPTDELKPLTMS